MLSLLKIRNLALVEELTWEVGEGLIGVTGETGAGKSMIVGALKLILGERADRSLVRSGTNTCSVEAVFRIGNSQEVGRFLDERGFDPLEGEDLVLKRSFGTSGPNRQFINCSPATLAVLRDLGKLLVDLHGPHDHQALLSNERQLGMLDAYAKAKGQSETYRAAYSVWRDLQREVEEVRNAGQAGEREMDLLRYQVSEIDAAELKPGDEDELDREYSLASNAGRIRDSCSQILGHLSADTGSVIGRLAEVQKAILDLERIDPKATKFTQGFDATLVELEELKSGIESYADRIDYDRESMAGLERRVDELETLKRKYGNTAEEILAFGQAATERLRRAEGRGEELERLETAEASAREAVIAAGSTLTATRRKTAPRLAKDIATHLGDLGFLQSKFEVQIAAVTEPGPRGMEGVEFLFAPNPGEPPKALRVVASSGEISRVMLAVKSALAKEDSIPLMVFDEIDANVGGEIAHAVGAKMASLGKRHQVVAISHLPQVAAVAHCHYVVHKEVEGEKTRSLLREVDGQERVEEIARMLGGGGTPELALAGNLLAQRAD